VAQAVDTAVMVATAEEAGVAKVVSAAEVERVVKVARAVPVGLAAVPADLAAASANSSARKKCASFVSKKWTSSTTSAPTFFPSLCRSAEKFFRAA
jgi:hypothetical protein